MAATDLRILAADTTAYRVVPLQRSALETRARTSCMRFMAQGSATVAASGPENIVRLAAWRGDPAAVRAVAGDAALTTNRQARTRTALDACLALLWACPPEELAAVLPSAFAAFVEASASLRLEELTATCVATQAQRDGARRMTAFWDEQLFGPQDLAVRALDYLKGVRDPVAPTTRRVWNELVQPYVLAGIQYRDDSAENATTGALAETREKAADQVVGTEPRFGVQAVPSPATTSDDTENETDDEDDEFRNDALLTPCATDTQRKERQRATRAAVNQAVLDAQRQKDHAEVPAPRRHLEQGAFGLSFVDAVRGADKDATPRKIIKELRKARHQGKEEIHRGFSVQWKAPMKDRQEKTETKTQGPQRRKVVGHFARIPCTPAPAAWDLWTNYRSNPANPKHKTYQTVVRSPTAAFNARFPFQYKDLLQIFTRALEVPVAHDQDTYGPGHRRAAVRALLYALTDVHRWFPKLYLARTAVQGPTSNAAASRSTNETSLVDALARPVLRCVFSEEEAERVCADLEQHDFALFALVPWLVLHALRPRLAGMSALMGLVTLVILSLRRGQDADWRARYAHTVVAATEFALDALGLVDVDVDAEEDEDVDVDTEEDVEDDKDTEEDVDVDAAAAKERILAPYRCFLRTQLAQPGAWHGPAAIVCTLAACFDGRVWKDNEGDALEFAYCAVLSDTPLRRRLAATTRFQARLAATLATSVGTTPERGGDAAIQCLSTVTDGGSNLEGLMLTMVSTAMYNPELTTPCERWDVAGTMTLHSQYQRDGPSSRAGCIPRYERGLGGSALVRQIQDLAQSFCTGRKAVKRPQLQGKLGLRCL